jgi:hypothetical protein
MAERRSSEAAGEGADEEPAGSTEASRFALELGRSLSILSAEEIDRRFEQLIRRRWRESGADWVVISSNVSVEVDLPGVEARTVRARLELRREAGDLRVRIRPGNDEE